MASARELRRQQREEEGPGDEAEGAEEGPGPPRANLSPSSSFRAQRSARGSTFSLWQDIPDVRGSGVLATLSLRDCKLQEVRRGPGGAGPAGRGRRGRACSAGRGLQTEGRTPRVVHTLPDFGTRREKQSPHKQRGGQDHWLGFREGLGQGGGPCAAGTGVTRRRTRHSPGTLPRAARPP